MGQFAKLHKLHKKGHMHLKHYALLHGPLCDKDLRISISAKEG
jgi:hypothetical protein